MKREIDTLLNTGNKFNMIEVSSSANDMDIVAILESNNGFSNTPFITVSCLNTKSQCKCFWTNNLLYFDQNPPSVHKCLNIKLRESGLMIL